jgi:hypothetical protein
MQLAYSLHYMINRFLFVTQYCNRNLKRVNRRRRRGGGEGVGVVVVVVVVAAVAVVEVEEDCHRI